MATNCKDTLCCLIDFSKSFPDYVVKIKKRLSLFVERPVLYNPNILEWLFTFSCAQKAEKIFFYFVLYQGKDGLEVVSVLEFNLSDFDLTKVEDRLSSLYKRHIMAGECGRIIAFPDNGAWVLYEEILEEVGVIVISDNVKSSNLGFDNRDFISREYIEEQAQLGAFRREYVNKFLYNY